MAQLDFFLCKEEKIILAEIFFESGIFMIPDLHYNEEKFITIEDIDEYKRYVMSNTLMFLVHPDSFNYPLVFNSFEKDGKRLYYIQQRHGGPTIDFYSPGLIEERDKRIGPGFIGNHPFFYYGNEKIFISDFDKQLLKKYASAIKKIARVVKLKKRSFWIGEHTIKLCKEAGYGLVPIGDINLVNLIN